MNLSPGFLPVTTSQRRNNTCPPSKAGMGKRFMIAKMKESTPVMRQKDSQSQDVENNLVIEINPPRLSFAFTCPWNNFPMPLNQSPINDMPSVKPAGIASTNEYSSRAVKPNSDALVKPTPILPVSSTITVDSCGVP